MALYNSSGKLLECVLYDNTTGTTGIVTLNDSSANYTYIEIFYCSNQNTDYKSEKVYNPNGKSVRLQIININGTNQIIAIRSKRIVISGNKITNDQIGYTEIGMTGVMTIDGQDYIKVVRVVGYK